jgi:hypothetical protein
LNFHIFTATIRFRIRPGARPAEACDAPLPLVRGGVDELQERSCMSMLLQQGQKQHAM